MTGFNQIERSRRMDHKLVVNPQVARVFTASILLLAARAAGL